MKDLQNILRRTRRLENERTPYVLATVVQVEGSAYRGPGTRMLIESLDKSTGSISGGCLEGDVRQQSIGVLADGKAQLLHYDYTGEDDFLWVTGMGCSGVMRVFLERNPAPSIAALEASALNGESALLATIFRAEDGQHASAGQYLHIDHSGMERGDISGAQLQKKIRRDLQNMAEAKGSCGERSRLRTTTSRSGFGHCSKRWNRPLRSCYSEPVTTPNPLRKWQPNSAGASLWPIIACPTRAPNAFPAPNASGSPLPANGPKGCN